MTTSKLSLAVAVAVLAALAGCGGGAEPEPTTAVPSADPANRLREAQAQLAVCMKGKGFTYHPIVTLPKMPKGVEQEMSGDYAAMREYREKYGFGFAASIVYPNDGVGRMGASSEEEGNDPNSKVVAGLSKAQKEAYFEAMDACYLDMANKATGKKMRSMNEVYKAQQQMMKQKIAREIDGDPKLVELATAFAACLKGKGYQVTSQRPSEISRSSEKPFMNELEKLGWKPTMEQARSLLQREIKASLDDLECGKTFYATFRPKERQVFDSAQLIPGGGMAGGAAGAG